MGILTELFKQAIKKPNTNLFPAGLKEAPDTATLKIVLSELTQSQTDGNAATPTVIAVCESVVHVPSGFRGRVHYYKENCKACGACLRVCPSKAIEELIPEEGKKKGKIKIYVSRCTFCEMCVDACNFKALKMGNKATDFLLASLGPYDNALTNIPLITTGDPIGDLEDKEEEA